MAKLFYLIFLLATCTVSVIAGRSSPSPSSPPSSCSGLVMGMMDCLGYVRDGSSEAVPPANCCGELDQVLKASPGCICEGFKMASNFGIKLNMTRAFGLPQACNLHAPPVVSHCSDSPSPAPAPVVPAPSPAPVVPSPSPSNPVQPPRASPEPAPPVSPPTKPQPSPSPPAPLPVVPPAEPPAQVYQGPSLAPSSSSSLHLSSSLLVLCVGVAVSSFSYLQV